MSCAGGFFVSNHQHVIAGHDAGPLHDMPEVEGRDVAGQIFIESAAELFLYLVGVEEGRREDALEEPEEKSTAPI